MKNIRGFRVGWGFIGLLLVMIVLSVLSFSLTVIPFLISPVLLSVPCWFLLFTGKDKRYRIVGFNLGVIFLIIGFVEGGCIYLEKRHGTFIRSEVLEDVYESEPDSILGWKLTRNTSRLARKMVNGERVYEARITVDSMGLRITPRCSASCPRSVLFFGNSLTYGEGVDDSLTLPYQFKNVTGDRYRVYNFGVYGYGPQHMLALLEFGMVDTLIDEDPEHIILLMNYPEHAYRVIGYWSWDISGPMYVLDEKGNAVHAGNFNRNIKRYRLRTGILGRSAFCRKIFNYQRALHEEEKQLFLTVVRQSKRWVDRKFPGADFHILLWDWSMGEDTFIFDAMRREGIIIHDIKQIIPDYQTNMQHRIGRYDRHPNGATYRLLAEYLGGELLQDREKE